MSTHIIGCGGVGSWLVPAILRLVPSKDTYIHDGDKLEEKNMDRQLFSISDIGTNKAIALAKHNASEPVAVPEFYYFGCFQHTPEDVIFCCADNNAARINVIQSVDYFGCRAIIAANEVHSAEAYYYCPNFKDTDLDPRHYYPELLIEDGNDPLHPSCTGQAQVAEPQLVTANFMAAALAQQLYVANIMEGPKLDAEVLSMVPYRLVANLTKLMTFRPKDIEKKGTDEKEMPIH